jgi:hypothetical protein
MTNCPGKTLCRKSVRDDFMSDRKFCESGPRPLRVWLFPRREAFFKDCWFELVAEYLQTDDHCRTKCVLSGLSTGEKIAFGGRLDPPQAVKIERDQRSEICGRLHAGEIGQMAPDFRL